MMHRSIYHYSETEESTSNWWAQKSFMKQVTSEPGPPKFHSADLGGDISWHEKSHFQETCQHAQVVSR